MYDKHLYRAVSQCNVQRSIAKSGDRLFPSRVNFPTHKHCLLQISNLCISDVTTFQSLSFQTSVTHLPDFATSSHSHVTLLFYPGSEQSHFSHAYPPVLRNTTHSLYSHQIITKKYPTNSKFNPLYIVIIFFTLYIFVLICYSTTVLYLSIPLFARRKCEINHIVIVIVIACHGRGMQADQR